MNHGALGDRTLGSWLRSGVLRISKRIFFHKQPSQDGKQEVYLYFFLRKLYQSALFHAARLQRPACPGLIASGKRHVPTLERPERGSPCLTFRCIVLIGNVRCALRMALLFSDNSRKHKEQDSAVVPIDD